MPAPQLRVGLRCLALLLFSIGLDAPMIGDAQRERKQDDAEESDKKVHTIEQERTFERKQQELGFYLKRRYELFSHAGRLSEPIVSQNCCERVTPVLFVIA